MATGEEIKTLVEDFASDLAQAIPDPAGWGIWLGLLLEELERQAADQDQLVEQYDATLELLRNSGRGAVTGASITNMLAQSTNTGKNQGRLIKLSLICFWYEHNECYAALAFTPRRTMLLPLDGREVKLLH